MLASVLLLYYYYYYYYYGIIIIAIVILIFYDYYSIPPMVIKVVNIICLVIRVPAACPQSGRRMRPVPRKAGEVDSRWALFSPHSTAASTTTTTAQPSPLLRPLTALTTERSVFDPHDEMSNDVMTRMVALESTGIRNSRQIDRVLDCKIWGEIFSLGRGGMRRAVIDTSEKSMRQVAWVGRELSVLSSNNR